MQTYILTMKNGKKIESNAFNWLEALRGYMDISPEAEVVKVEPKEA